MATVTDTLQTLLRMDGGPAYAANLDAAAKKLDLHAAAETRAMERSAGLKAAFSALGGSAALVGLEVGALAALVTKSVQTFAEDEETIFRTAVVLRNLGNSYPIERAQAFASAIQRTVAIDDEAVVGLIGLEKRFGVADNQIESTTRTIIDFSKATGISLEEAGQRVGRAILGQTRGLRQMGIQMTDTGNKAQNLAIIQKKLNDLFGGAGEAERNTVTGTFVALRESLNNLLSAVGDKLSTVIVPVLNTVIKLIDYLTAHVAVFTTALGAAIGARFGPLGALIGGLVGLGIGLLPGKANPAQQVGNGKEKLATEETLGKIEQNTAKTAEAFIKGVLGGPGTIAKAAFTARDAKLAFGI